MEAKLVAALPEEPGWQYEPKWDGYRCLAFRHGSDVEIMSKSGKSLARYFPEVVAMLARLGASDFVIDGELILPVGEVLSFGALQSRLHPAESRIRKLSLETPAQLMAFDCLQLSGEMLADQPLDTRRAALERLFAAEDDPALLLSPCTGEAAVASQWLAQSGGALDGVVAKRRDESYRFGERAMVKIKQHRSADCVVGGFRYDRAGKEVASLLLGLHDDAGLLNHVGFTSGLAAVNKAELTARLEALVEAPGFTGKAPGGPSRWSTDRSADWQPLRTELVVEVLYDQVTDDRFRHGTRLLRWRPDKAPRQCTMEQLVLELRPAELAALASGPATASGERAT
jgi:ATP-dependent DNA ligase